MLYTESKQYLIDKLKAAGIKSKPFTTEKALEKSQESHIGAVLFERETFTRNGSKKRYRDEEGTLHKRRTATSSPLRLRERIGSTRTTHS